MLRPNIYIYIFGGKKLACDFCWMEWIMIRHTGSPHNFERNYGKLEWKGWDSTKWRKVFVLLTYTESKLKKIYLVTRMTVLMGKEGWLRGQNQNPRSSSQKLQWIILRKQDYAIQGLGDNGLGSTRNIQGDSEFCGCRVRAEGTGTIVPVLSPLPVQPNLNLY